MRPKRRRDGAVLSQVRAPTASLWRVALQYGRFGAVGAVATVIHVVLFGGLIEATGMAPLIANVVAFGAAMLVSFCGHRDWTFRPADADRAAAARSLRRFVVVALLGLALNSLAVYLTVDLLGLSYRFALLPMVSLVPLAVFVLSKFWAFA